MEVKELVSIIKKRFTLISSEMVNPAIMDKKYYDMCVTRKDRELLPRKFKNLVC